MAIRKLASIQKIDKIEIHTNADSLELATVGGWQVVIKKGQFKTGELIIYCEIDSILPDKPEFEFLRSKNFRIKTIKLRGELSQGIIFGLDILPQDISTSIQLIHSRVGDKILGTDLTEKLEITKHEPPLKGINGGETKGSLPPFVIKTDEQRLQSAMSLIDEMTGLECYITVKEDGTSFSAYYNDGNFGICSRNLELKLDDNFSNATEKSIERLNSYAKIAKQYDLENKLKAINRNIVIQGEITGSGIQGNPMELPVNTHQFHVFNVYDIDNHKYLDYDEFKTLMYTFDIPTVETIFRGLFTFTLEQLLELASGKYMGTRNNREGIVIRPVIESFSKKLHGRLSFKVINNDYLLGEK
jgi:RNA ligase (TIGR02306 family)